MTGIFTYRNFSLADTPPLVHKVAIVTGGAAGIGREITATLLLHDIEKVFVLARNESKFEDARKEWTENKGIKPLDLERRAEFIACDLGDVLQVKKAADEIFRRTDRLDIVVCNAAIPTVPTFTLSPQGIDASVATNHVGHHALCSFFIPLLSSTAITYSTTPRIIITTSSLHHFCHHISIPALSSTKPPKWPASYDGIYRYARSKLLNVLFTKELSRRLSDSGVPGEKAIYVNAYFPGNIATDAMDTWKQLFGSLAGWAFKSFFRVAGQSVGDAAATVMYLAAAEDVGAKDLRGRYFIPVATEAGVSKVGEDGALAREVWVWTEDVIRRALEDGQNGSKDAMGVITRLSSS